MEDEIELKEPMKVVIDTNVLIDNAAVLLDETLAPLIPYTVLHELDGLKRNPDLKRAAQSAIKLIHDGMIDGRIEVTNIPTAINTPDERIVKAAKTKKVPFMTGDIGAQAIAMARNVKLVDTLKDETIDYDYTGFTKVVVDAEYEKFFVQLKELQLEEFNERFGTDLRENEYCIIERIGEKNDIWVNKSVYDEDLKECVHTVHRISQSMKPYRDAGILISPMDDEQMCALDAVFDPNIPLTVIDGVLGTGKTVLSLMAALACTIGQKRYMHYEQILVTKPPVSINKDHYTGFKPGTREEKMSGHLGGIKSNLKFLLDREKKKKDLKPGEEPEPSESELVWLQNFGVIEIDEIQGTSLHNTILLVDEYQLLDTDSLKLVLSRISEGSKVILIGDTMHQTYSQNRANEGFKTLYKFLGTAPEFNYIKLGNIYRSKLAKLVATIFND